MGDQKVVIATTLSDADKKAAVAKEAVAKAEEEWMELEEKAEG